MAVPKRKTPRSKTRMRRAANWRLEAPATWRIMLDKGEDACDCSRP